MQTKTAKQEVTEFIATLPDDVTKETIVAQLEFKLLIEARLRDVQAGNVVSHEEAKRQLSKWLDSPGP